MKKCEACGQESVTSRKRCVICRRLLCCSCWDLSNPSVMCAEPCVELTAEAENER